MEAEERLVGAGRILQVRLGGGTAQNEVSALGRDAADAAALVPRKATLATIDQLKLTSLEGGRYLSQGGIAGIWKRHVVAGRVAEGSIDGPVEGPGHEEQGLGHLSGLAMGETAVAGHGIVCDLAALQPVSKIHGQVDDGRDLPGDRCTR